MANPAFTFEEKARIRAHLGYTNVSAVQTFALGTPAAVEPAFIIERAMDVVLPEALHLARQYLEVLDRIDCQRLEDLELMAVNKVDEIEVRKEEQLQLRNEYLEWRGRLANLLGVMANPYDKRFAGSQGLNCSVVH